MDDVNTDLQKDTQNDDKIEWDHEVPIFTNRFFYQDCIMVSAFTLLACASFFGVFNLLYYIKYRQFISIPVYSEYTFPAILFFFIIIALASCVVFIFSKNRYLCRFVITRDGISISFLQDKGIFKILGLFNFKSLFSRPDEIERRHSRIFYHWDEIERAVPYPKIGAIALYGVFTRNAIVYCPKDRFKEILQLVLNALWRTEKERKAGIEKTKKRFLLKLLWVTYLFIMVLLASEAPLLETDLPIWILFILSVVATTTNNRIRVAIGLTNFFILTVIGVFMVYKGLKMEYSGLGMFAYNFFRNLVHFDYLLFFILSMTGFVGFVVYSWVIILTREEDIQGVKPVQKPSEYIIRTGLILMFIIVVSIAYAFYWQIYRYEKATESLPETIKYLTVYKDDNKETKEFKISYNAMLDALYRYHNTEDKEKKKAYEEYRRLRKIVFEKKQKMLEGLGKKQNKAAQP